MSLLFVCFLLSAFCLLPSATAATWSRQQTGTLSGLRAVYFLNHDHGWVAGTGGTLLETVDGGANWKRLLPLTRDNISDIYFANERIGWLLCERDVLKLKEDEARSYLLKTEDGGFSWRRVFLNTAGINARFVRIVFAGTERGWVFGETGLVFATRDGGARWLRQASPTKRLLLGGAAADQSHVCLVGAGSTIIQTNDGGATWQTGVLRDVIDARLTAASFAGPGLGWAVGMAGRVIATRDGGRTWHEQRSNVDQDLHEVKFVNPSEGWAAGSQGTLLHTVDGGLHWVRVTSGTSHALERLFFIDRDHGWAVGFGGTVLRYGETGAPRLKS